MAGSRKIDLTGRNFGRLVVIREAGRKRKEVAWECLCKCGKTVVVNGYALRSGHTQSCGCYAVDRAKAENTKHGMFGTLIYRTYANMKNRCYNPNYYLFKHYGGKGVSVCETWLGDNGFDNFYQWSLLNGYREGLSIDRIDNSKNYCPENCRWVDMTTQQNNRTNNRVITVNGETHTMAEWSRIKGIKYETIQRRIAAGWRESDAVSLKGGCHAPT